MLKLTLHTQLEYRLSFGVFNVILEKSVLEISSTYSVFECTRTEVYLIYISSTILSKNSESMLKFQVCYGSVLEIVLENKYEPENKISKGNQETQQI